MKLMLPGPVVDIDVTIRHSDQLLFIGSCFSDEMQPYFNARKFSTLSNPHGVLYNPVSMARSLRQIVKQENVDTAAFYERAGLWFSFHHHSCLSATSSSALEQKLKEVNQEEHTFLQKMSYVFITLGTSWVFEHQKLGQVVANNLKAPAHFFDKKLLSMQNIRTALQEIVLQVQAMNTDAKIIFTLSPVRHTRLGLAENNRSKARLLEAIHELVHQEAKAFYFPSYELVLDVLRDYRFYKKDLVHPNSLATDAVWDLIQDNLIAREDKELMETLAKISLSVQHKIMQTESTEAQKFINAQLDKIQQLEIKYDYLDLSAEKKYYEEL